MGEVFLRANRARSRTDIAQTGDGCGKGGKQVKAESGQGKAADSAKSSINRIKKALILLSISGLIALLPCLTVSPPSVGAQTKQFVIALFEQDLKMHTF